jgi:hypothetical protein
MRRICTFIVVFVMVVCGVVSARQKAKEGDCYKTYLIQPGNVALKVIIFKSPLSPRDIATVIDAERIKYKDSGYTLKNEPGLRDPTNRLNCAGYVMSYLLPNVFRDGKVDVDDFDKKILKPFFDGPLSIIRASAGDVVVYRTTEGRIGHVALVTGTGLKAYIRSKDNNERPYFGTVPRVYGFDPLTSAHQGGVEIWRRKVNFTLQPVYSGDCDTGGDIAGYTLGPDDYKLVDVIPDPEHKTEERPGNTTFESYSFFRSLFRYKYQRWDRSQDGLNTKIMVADMAEEYKFQEPPPVIKVRTEYLLTITGTAIARVGPASFGCAARYAGADGVSDNGGNPKRTIIYRVFVPDSLSPTFDIVAIANCAGTVTVYRYCKGGKCPSK